MNVLALNVLDPTTMVPLGVVCVVGLLLVGAIIRGTRALDTMKQDVHEIREDQKRTNEAIAQKWSVKDQQIWALTFKLRNPNLNVPGADEESRT